MRPHDSDSAGYPTTLSRSMQSFPPCPLFAGQNVVLEQFRDGRPALFHWPLSNIVVIFINEPAESARVFNEDQLCFFFMEPTRPRVINFIAKSNYPYLNSGVYELFRSQPHAARVALRLQKKGMKHIGHLVQLTEDELNAFSFMTPEAMIEIKARLHVCGLRLGAAVPPWNAGYWEDRPYTPRLG